LSFSAGWVRINFHSVQ